MRAVLQRVREAAVTVGGETVGACGVGFLILLGVEKGDTERDAERLAAKIARGPLNCYSASKALMNKAHETTFAQLLDEETEAQADARMNPNAEEGLGAFLEKRKAAFK